jgi:hypothetical protein
MPPLFYIASGKDSPLEADFRKNTAGEIVRNDYVLSADEIQRIKLWVGADELHHLELNPGPVIQVSRTYEGNTAIVYWVRSSSIENPVNFRLQAVQYGRDKLRVGLIDYIDLSPVEYLKTWLQWGWGDAAAKTLELEGVPPDMGNRSSRWQPRSEADRWLIDQYFDVHNEQRALAYFKDDWIRRREEELVQIPTDADNSMAQIIAKERKWRIGE